MDETSKKLKLLFQWLSKEAEKDGIVTPEEKAILEKISDSMENWSKAINLAFEDGHLDNNELKALKDLLIRIEEEVFDVASKDGFSKDEQTLLAKALIGLKALTLK